jgi:hypothetical protein
VAQRVEQHQQDVGRGAVVDQRIDRRVGGEAAVPVGLAVDLDRVVERGQAGRGEQRVGAELRGVEQPDLAGAHLGGGDEEAQPALAADALEVEARLHHVAQRVEVEGVELVGREQPGEASIMFIGPGRLPSAAPLRPLRLWSRSSSKGVESATASQKPARLSRAPSAPPRTQPSARATAFIAPALVPLIPSSRQSSSSRRSSTPQV